LFKLKNMIALKYYYIIFCFFFLFGGNGNAQNLMLSIPKNNQIYVGIDYEMELGFVGQENQNFEVSISKEGTIKRINANKYVINVCSPGLMNIEVKYKDSVFVKPIIVKGYNIEASLLGYESRIPIDVLSKLEKLNCAPVGENIKVKCDVTYFKFAVRRNGNNSSIVDVENNGANFNKVIKSYIKTLSVGDAVSFLGIRAKCACDTSDYPIGSMSFMIK
jgi:hypothetical protein